MYSTTVSIEPSVSPDARNAKSATREHAISIARLWDALGSRELFPMNPGCAGLTKRFEIDGNTLTHSC